MADPLVEKEKDKKKITGLLGGGAGESKALVSPKDKSLNNNLSESKGVKEKGKESELNSSSNSNNKDVFSVCCAFASLQGGRPSMEDEVFVSENFTVEKTKETFHFYGVFDGHGGTTAAVYAKKQIFAYLREELEQGAEVEKALTHTFIRTDKDFIRDNKGDTSGSTAVVALINHDTRTLWVANVGDSRAVLARDELPLVEMSNDHKADRPDEMERIKAAGGFVIHKRVMGELAVSRALGDADYKDQDLQLVIPVPEIRKHNLGPKDQFLLLACDGLYDVMSNSEAVNHISRSLFEKGNSVQEAADAIAKFCVRDLQTRDNVSAVLVLFSFSPAPTSS